MAQNKLRIDTGAVTVEVNDNGDEICFVPDVSFVKRFEALYAEIDRRAEEFKKRETELNANDGKDANGVPENMRDRIALVEEVCLYCEEKIDGLFGENSCKKALNGAMHPNYYAELLAGLAPFIQDIRNKKISKYKK